jgi:symplekin
VAADKRPEVALAAFKMPAPQPLSSQEVIESGQGTISRVFGAMQSLEDSSLRKNKAGINRLAASSFDREAWITVITRLSTRAPAALDSRLGSLKYENELPKVSLSDTIRESLYLYVLEDFRRRIDIAVAWLCEEWYNDQIQQKLGQGNVLHYERWVLRLLDGMIPYLDARDKVLTRFLSEVPGLTMEMLDRVKNLCRDPVMVNLALTSLLYLVMMRPPVRNMALDAVEDVWRTCEYIIPDDIIPC